MLLLLGLLGLLPMSASPAAASAATATATATATACTRALLPLLLWRGVDDNLAVALEDGAVACDQVERTWSRPCRRRRPALSLPLLHAECRLCADSNGAPRRTLRRPD